MGKGDCKTKKGKRFRHSYGKKRPRKGRNKQNKKARSVHKLFTWSIERIYYECGRFNRTTNIIFRNGSGSFKKYGNLITGDIYYTPEEREKLETTTKNGISTTSDGSVKFKLLLKEGFSSDKVRDLQLTGFPNKDILKVECYSLPSVNKFAEKGTCIFR